MAYRILLQEQDKQLKRLIQSALENEHYDVIPALHAAEALHLFDSEKFDLIILDLAAPSINGLTISEGIRVRNKEIPILVLTGRIEPDERLQVLRSGADEYLTKPFIYDELVLRVKRLLARRRWFYTPNPSLHLISFGDNYINFDNYHAIGVSGPVQLTKKETALLRLLVEHKNDVVSREKMLEAVWGFDVYPNTRSIDNFIMAFRRYFESDHKNPVHFLAVRGVGYKFME